MVTLRNFKVRKKCKIKYTTKIKAINLQQLFFFFFFFFHDMTHLALLNIPLGMDQWINTVFPTSTSGQILAQSPYIQLLVFKYLQ